MSWKLLNGDLTKHGAIMADKKGRAERKAKRKADGIRAIMVRAGKLSEVAK